MGAPCLPPRVHAVNDSLNAEYELTALVSRNLQMEKDLEKLKRDHACAVGECHEAHNKIKDLEAKLSEFSIKEENLDNTIKDTLENKAKQLSIENDWYREKIKVKDDEIQCVMSELTNISLRYT